MNSDACPRCGAPTDPSWFCSEGYCPDCCQETDEEPPVNEIELAALVDEWEQALRAWRCGDRLLVVAHTDRRVVPHHEMIATELARRLDAPVTVGMFPASPHLPAVYIGVVT